MSDRLTRAKAIADELAALDDEATRAAVTCERQVLATLEAGCSAPLGALAEVVADARLVLVLEDIVDHTNVGAAFRAAAGLGADAVVVPCVVNHKSARGLQKAMRAIESNGIPSHRVVLVITHDGGSEDEEFLQHLREQLAQNYRVRALIEVPHDPAIRRDGELTYSDLLPVTRHTIRRLARHVVEALNDAPTTKPNLTLTESE